MNESFNERNYCEALIKMGVEPALARLQSKELEKVATAKQPVIPTPHCQETEARLRKELRDLERRLLKWQWGTAIVLAFLIIKAFGWLEF